MTARAAGSSDVYRWLISPLTPEEFECHFYQQKLCVVSRGQPDYFGELLSFENLDLMWATHAIRHPDVSIVRSDRDIPPSEYTDSSGAVDQLGAARLFADGATIIFTHLHSRIPSLSRFCAALARATSSPIQTNVYLTPQGSQGFAAHWDTHDVFILQIAGRKRWTTYDSPMTLPLRGQQFDHKQHKPGAVKEEFELQPGDMAYIPRGLMHSARSSLEPSLHITTGLLAFTWADLFLQAVAEAAIDDVSLREALPFGFSCSDYPETRKAALYEERLNKLSEYMASHPPFAALGDEVVLQHKPVLTDVLKQVTRLGDLTVTSTVRTRPDVVWTFRDNETACSLVYRGRQLSLPKFTAPALEFLAQTERCEVRGLPDCIDEQGKLTLVRRLIREGILECLDF